MTTTIRDIESAEQMGRVLFERWREKFEQQFYRPLILDQMRQLVASATPDQLAQMQAAYPVEYDQMISDLAGGE